MNTLTKTEQRPAAAETAQRVNYLTPASNILETGDGYILQAEMPGVSKDGIEVTVTNGELTIVGRRAEKMTPGTAVYVESHPLDYRRAFDLDPAVDTGKITAKMEQGILTLTLPKAEEVKPQRIKVTD